MNGNSSKRGGACRIRDTHRVFPLHTVRETGAR